LLDEAKSKLKIENWDIGDVVKHANLDEINAWIANLDEQMYLTFLSELEKSHLSKETKEKIAQVKLVKLSNTTFESFNNLIKKDKYNDPCFGYLNCLFNNNKTKGIKKELVKLGLIVSEICVEDYPKIFSSINLPDDKKYYDLIEKCCASNSFKLDTNEKKTLFLNFINRSTKFDNVGDETLKKLELFCDANQQIKALNQLVSPEANTPSFFNSYQINKDEFFTELSPYLVSETDMLFSAIYIPRQDSILAELSEANEIKKLIDFYKENQQSFFKAFIIKKTDTGFRIDQKTDDTHQVQSPDKEARLFMDKHCVSNLFVLPSEFLSHKEEEGIIKANELYSLLLKYVNVNEHQEALVDIVKYKAQYDFLQKITNIRLRLEAQYTTNDYEYKLLALACRELKKEDFQKFRDSIVIEVEGRELKLSEVPPFVDTIKIEGHEISLAKILPNNYQNSNYLTDLINQFINLGLTKDSIAAVFGLSEEPELSEVFQIFSEQVEVLENAQQLAFLFLYGLYIEKIDFGQFTVLNINNEQVNLRYDKYLIGFDFIKTTEILHPKYQDIIGIVKKFPIRIEDNDNLLLIKEPYFVENQFICPYIEENLSEEGKLGLIKFLFDYWGKDKKNIIKNIDWSTIDEVQTINILGFNPRISVYPSEYACQDEVLPDYLIFWVNEDQSKIEFLADLGVWTMGLTIIELRQYLIGKTNKFNSNILLQEKRFNNDETTLFNTFVWLKENNQVLKTMDQFDVFKQMVNCINENRRSSGIAALEIEEEFNFDELTNNSKEWNETYYQEWNEYSDISISLYNGGLPKLISLDEVGGFIFYSSNNENIAIDEDDNIYINRNSDIKKELQNIETDIDFSGLWESKADALEREIEELKNQVEGYEELTEKYEELLGYDIKLDPGYTNVRAHKRRLSSAKDGEYGQNNANIHAPSTSDISKNDQNEANREAKELVKTRLENEGYSFTLDLGKYSTIDGVQKDGIEYPLVVKSYKYQEYPLKIGANEWVQLMKPNAMLWLNFGHDNLQCLDLNNLLRNQDKLAISFSTENLEEGRLDKFAELLRYFNDVHFDFTSIMPSNLANDLADYRFDKRTTEEDTSPDDDNLL
jgi:hypothetical protein